LLDPARLLAPVRYAKDWPVALVQALPQDVQDGIAVKVDEAIDQSLTELFGLKRARGEV